MIIFRLITITLVLSISTICNAQNIIPNGSFEDTVQLNFGLTGARHWSIPTKESPNHYHPAGRPEWRTPLNISGYQQAYSGVAYYGLKMYSLYDPNRDTRREYIQVKLNRTLLFDSTYCMRMYVSLADSFKFASRGQLGLYFSNTAVGSNDFLRLPYTPQIIVSPTDYITDKINWTEFNFKYKATGNERYLTIGNFNDTTLQDTLYVGSLSADDFNYKATYYYIDDVWLSHCDSVVGIEDEKLRKESFEIYPNPSNGLLTIETEKQIKQLLIYNVQGQLVKQIIQPSKQIELPEAQGVYFLRIELESGEVVNRKEVKN